MRKKRQYVPPASPGPMAKKYAKRRKPPKARGTGPFYLAALVGTLLSLDTAARYFAEELGINGLIVVVNGYRISLELTAVCSVGELTLIACGYAMRHSVRRSGRPGPAQLVAVAICAAATFVAIALEGVVGGLVRAAFGPVLALVTLHLALGIEIKVRRGVSNGTWARIGRELRERALSRFGLADDSRDALARTRDRAVQRAARLATTSGWVLRRDARLARAVRASGVALDAVQRDRMLRQVAAFRHLNGLKTIELPSPWLLHAEVTTTQPPVTAGPAPTMVPQLIVPSGEVRGWEQKRRQVAEAIEWARAEIEHPTRPTPTAKRVGDVYGRSESWGRDVLKRAMAAESSNGKAGSHA